jgi:hypothetical protein
MLDLNPSIVVEGSHAATGRITRALKKKREKARAFSSYAEQKHEFSVIAGCRLLTDFVIGS